MSRNGHDTDDDIPLILRILKRAGGSAEPEEVVRKMADYGLGSGWSKDAIREGLNSGQLGLSLDFKLIPGDGKSLWP